jgi:regulator of protease activity HflC (stomatin/prohibitin superfamily)
MGKSILNTEVSEIAEHIKQGRREAKRDDEKIAVPMRVLWIPILLGVGVAVIAFVAVAVPAGHVGILDTFGSVAPTTFAPGFHLKLPITWVEPISIKTQEIKEDTTVPSNEGLLVTLETSVLYKLSPNSAIEIYKTVGKNYQEVVVVPQIRSAIRETTASYEAKALYTSAREKIADEIFTRLKPDLEQRGIILEKVLLRDLKLPEKVTSAIEAKLEAEQQSEQMKFVLTKEELEADRKRIEAAGIKDSQEIIAESLTDSYLTWYWIQNLKEHSSVIYVPIEERGLPIFKEIDNTGV